MGEAIDGEIQQLLGKLSRIQDEVGTIGGKKAGQAKKSTGDKFEDLKLSMIDKLVSMHEDVTQCQRFEKQPGSNPRELIAIQNKIRGDLILVQEDFKELEALFRKEASKRRSKLTPQEMAIREKVLTDFQLEMQNIKDAVRTGNAVHSYKSALPTLAESEMFRGAGTDSLPRPKGVGGAHNNDMTDVQRMQLKQIKDRDAQFDNEILKIGEGVEDLREIALAQNEEVKLQNKMLTNLEEKVDAVHDKVFNVNQRLKTTIEEVRSSDKICLDIFCVLILVGMLIVVIKVTTNA
jgi:SYP7 family syntaxin